MKSEVCRSPINPAARALVGGGAGHTVKGFAEQFSGPAEPTSLRRRGRIGHAAQDNRWVR